MNLMNRPPLGLKPEKSRRDPDYLERVRQLPCCICEAFGFTQTSPTQAHHVICGRGGFRKSPDRMSIPLCDGHHLGDFDVSKIAIHRDRALWVDWYGEDTEYVAITQDKLLK